MTFPINGQPPESPKIGSQNSGNCNQANTGQATSKPASIFSDGVFTIKEGEGLSDAIGREIGLTDEQLNQMDKATWAQIMKEVDKQKSVMPDLYRGGNDIYGDTDKNFIVNPGQEIKISLKNAWNNILGIVNKTLGTDFKAAELANNSAEAGQVIPGAVPVWVPGSGGIQETGHFEFQDLEYNESNNNPE